MSTSLEISSLPANELARAYQPRRVAAAFISAAWNLAGAAAFIIADGPTRIAQLVAGGNFDEPPSPSLFLSPVHLAIFFILYAAWNAPLDLWFGYLQEREFGLAKHGIRGWIRDYARGMAQHGLMFIIGGWLILASQHLFHGAWLFAVAAVLLALFLASARFAQRLLPPGLFHIAPADGRLAARLAGVLPAPLAGAVPPVRIYSSVVTREFAGGAIGLGAGHALFLSQPTVNLASEGLLRFVLIREIGRRRLRHILLATLLAWAFAIVALIAGHAFINLEIAVRDAVTPFSALPVPSREHLLGFASYIAFLSLGFTLAMLVLEPLLAFISRRLEYQADRFYLQNGGALDEMRSALHELAARNLARTDRLRRRHSLLHPLPTPANRLHAARRFAAGHLDAGRVRRFSATFAMDADAPNRPAAPTIAAETHHEPLASESR